MSNREEQRKAEYERRARIVSGSKTISEAARTIGIATSSLQQWMATNGVAPKNSKIVRNTMNEAGARHIKKTIEDYWSSLGYKVNCTIHCDQPLNGNAYRFDVRSDMVNGYPKELSQ